MWIFDCAGVSTSNPCVVAGSALLESRIAEVGV